MYKIYINENLLCLGTSDEIAALTDVSLAMPYYGKSKALLNLSDRLEKVADGRTMAVSSDDPHALWSDFQGLYRVIPAAGGLILNNQEELLLIYRRGYWDLPKGKQDEGEELEQTATREVAEETGLKVTLGTLAGETWHTYRSKKGKRILKPTFWYHMYAPETDLTLQSEEDIEDAQWISPSKVMESDLVIYRNIAELIDASQFLVNK